MNIVLAHDQLPTLSEESIVRNVLARQGPDDKVVRTLAKHNRGKSVCLRHIGNQGVQIMRKHHRVTVGPQAQQSRGQRDTDNEVNGEGTMLKSTELLPRQGPECNDTL